MTVDQDDLWTSPIRTASFAKEETLASPRDLFFTYDSSASPEAALERAERQAAWLAAEPGASMAAIDAAMRDIRTSQARAGRIGSPPHGRPLWAAAARQADRAMEQVVRIFLAASSPESRARAALQSAPSRAFDPAGFLQLLSARGIVAKVDAAGGVSLRGAAGKLGPADVEKLKKHRREIELCLMEQAHIATPAAA